MNYKQKIKKLLTSLVCLSMLCAVYLQICSNLYAEEKVPTLSPEKQLQKILGELTQLGVKAGEVAKEQNNKPAADPAAAAELELLNQLSKMAIGKELPGLWQVTPTVVVTKGN